MSIHKDHRKRVKSRFRQEGLDGFDEVHALELLLFFSIPQGDVNPLAHRLINHFGSLRQVLEAPADQLAAVSGVGEHSAVLLSLVRGLSKKYMLAGADSFRCLNSVEQYGNYLMDCFIGMRDEAVYLLCLDGKRKVLACRLISLGSVNSTDVSVRKVVETALSVNATIAILAHNHPSGIAVPSVDDIVTTRRMACALDLVGVLLEDHIVVADRDFVSLAQSNYYNPDDCRVIV